MESITKEEIEACKDRGGGFEVAPDCCISCEQFALHFPTEYAKHKMKEHGITYYEGFNKQVKEDESTIHIINE